MPTDQIDIINRIYRALAGNGTDLFDLLHPAIDWVTPATLPWTVPGSDGHYMGHDELGTYFESCLKQVEDFQVAVTELLPAGDRVLMVGSERGRARTTGKTFDARCAHLWTLDRGKASRLDGFIDTATVTQAFV